VIKNLHFDHPLKAVLFQKIKSLGYKIYFISGDFFEVSPPLTGEMDDPQVSELKSAWETQRNSRNKDQLVNSFDKTLSHADVERPKAVLNPHIWQLHGDSTTKNIIILVEDLQQLPWYDLNQLVDTGVIEAGFLPIHSNAILKDHKLLLFGGSSGAGKSTVAALSHHIHARVLDEDQILIREEEPGVFSADAWGYSLEKSNARIAGIIKIIQSEENKLNPMSQTDTAKFLFHQALEVCGTNNIRMAEIFAFSSRLARTVPGYALQFTKSGTFWHLIEKEFGFEK